MAKKVSKNYKAAKALLEKESYSLEEAVKLLPETSKVKFDASIEVHVNTGLDPRHADQILRFTTKLPNGTGKKYKIIAFVPDEMTEEAKKAGAIKAGLEDLVGEVSKGFMDFDFAVAHPTVMRNLAKIAKQLGQARKMPTPKNGTVNADISAAISDLSSGQIEVRTDKNGSTHNLVGKLSFGEEKIFQNVKNMLDGVKNNKPEGCKGTYIRSIYLTTSMGPSLNIDLGSIN